jgi:hypothetical protein
MRFSLRWLFGAVLLAALSFGALVNSNVYWAALAWMIAITFLAAAAVAGIHGTGKQRAFWFGVAGTGWVYLFFVSFTQFCFGRDFVCDELCRALWDVVGKQKVKGPRTMIGVDIPREVRLMAPPEKFFEVVIKCLVTGLVALAGGWACMWVYGRRVASKSTQQ